MWFLSKVRSFISVILDAQLVKANDADDEHGELFDIARFQELFGYVPNNNSFFLEAFVHRSYLHSHNGSGQSNERLEFLGDAILNFVVAERLFQLYPEMSEGHLTKCRARLVNRKILSATARRVQLHEFLKLGASAAQAVDQGSDSLLADAYEAVICAMYLDGGMQAVRAFIHRTLLSGEEAIKSIHEDENYKSALLEYSQSKGMGIPRYIVLEETGPDHDRLFTVGVAVGKRQLGIGKGRNKKEAEQAASAEALEHVRDIPLAAPSPEETENNADVA